MWAAQRMCDATLPPSGAKVLARPPPLAKPGKLGRRAVPAVFLHNSPWTPGSTRVALLQADGRVTCVTDRRTIRAVLSEEGRWVFPDVTGPARDTDAQLAGTNDDDEPDGIAAPVADDGSASEPVRPGALPRGDGGPHVQLVPGDQVGELLPEIFLSSPWFLPYG